MIDAYVLWLSASAALSAVALVIDTAETARYLRGRMGGG